MSRAFVWVARVLERRAKRRWRPGERTDRLPSVDRSVYMDMAAARYSANTCQCSACAGIVRKDHS